MAKFLSNDMQAVFAAFKAANPQDFPNGQLKVCIGGGAGFIGSHIARALMAEVCNILLYTTIGLYSHSKLHIL